MTPIVVAFVLGIVAGALLSVGFLAWIMRPNAKPASNEEWEKRRSLYAHYYPEPMP